MIKIFNKYVRKPEARPCKYERFFVSLCEELAGMGVALALKGPYTVKQIAQHMLLRNNLPMHGGV